MNVEDKYQGMWKGFVTVITLFFMWGFITVSVDPLIAALKAIFELNYAEAMLTQFAFFMAYFVVSLPAAALIARLGNSKSIIFALAVMVLGCLVVPMATKFNTYALGWFQHEYGGRRLNYHTGSIDGMVAIIGIIPEERFGVYVLGNLDHVEVRHALLYKAIDTWLGTGTRDWSKDLRDIYAKMQAQGDWVVADAPPGTTNGPRKILRLKDTPTAATPRKPEPSPQGPWQSAVSGSNPGGCRRPPDFFKTLSRPRPMMTGSRPSSGAASIRASASPSRPTGSRPSVVRRSRSRAPRWR